MNRKSVFKAASDRRLRLMVGAHLIWLGMVCLLGTWWGRLLLSQAAKISELEVQLGLAVGLSQNHWHRTQRMLYWESASFFTLLLACTSFLFWLYWRDVKRARGLQAFFASVTHELRTPLTSIRLQAESIADSLASDNSQKNLVCRLLEDSIRLEAQVERTLELARIEGGGPVYTQALQIKPWLERFLKTWKADYQGKFEFDSQIEDVLIQADSTAMQVIFKNLLENSVRHSKRDKVQISIQVKTSIEPKNPEVLVCLKDNGQGFQGDSKSLGKIFQKGPSSPGTGVGLYLVKVLMARMGGWVRFEVSTGIEPGFKVTLGFREGNPHG